MRTQLRDYQYIDAKRLNRYMEQLDGLLTYDKVPVVTTSLSIAGPEATTTQSRHQRKLTKHEKINLLLAGLQRFRDFHRGTECDMLKEAHLVHCRLDAVRGAMRRGRRFLGFWIADVSCTNGHRHDLGKVYRILLLEDYPPGNSASHEPRSPYMDILEYLADARSVLVHAGWTRPSPPAYEFAFWSEVGGSDPQSFLHREYRARFGVQRRIEALFRVRLVVAVRDMEMVPCVLGYPIFIAQ